MVPWTGYPRPKTRHAKRLRSTGRVRASEGNNDPSEGVRRKRPRRSREVEPSVGVLDFPAMAASLGGGVSTRRMTRAGLRAARREKYGGPDGHFAQLSDDLVLNILGRLPCWPDRLNVHDVCRRWRRLSKEPRLWHDISFGNTEAKKVPLQALEDLGHTPAKKHMRRLSLASVAAATEDMVRVMTRRSCGDNLQVIDLTECPGATDRSVVELSRCSKLRILRLARCTAVTRRSVKVLAMRCPELVVLDLAGVRGIRDYIVRDIYSACPFLHTLILEDTSVSDESIPKLVENCKFLSHLNVSKCVGVTDLSAFAIADHGKNITVLGLEATSVSDKGIVAIAEQCEKLHHLNINRCVTITDFAINKLTIYVADRIHTLLMEGLLKVHTNAILRFVKASTQLRVINIFLPRTRVVSPQSMKLFGNRVKLLM